MRNLQTHNYGWAVGGLNVLLGALMLISPHQFVSLSHITHHPNNWIAGSALTLTGLALISVWAIDLSRSATGWIHLAAGSVLLFLSADALASAATAQAAPIQALNYLLLGGGTVLAGLAHALRPQPENDPGPDLLLLSLGLSALLGGLLWALAGGPADAAGPAARPGFGLALALAGAWVTAIQLGRNGRARLLHGAWAAGAHALLGLLFIFTLVGRAQTGRVSFDLFVLAGFGLLLLAWPALRRLPLPMHAHSARAGIALALVTAAVLPLIFTVTVISAIHEAALAEQFLRQQDNRAVALAHDIRDYLMLYQAAVDELVQRPGWAEISAVEQRALLDGFLRAYPDLAFYAVYSPGGELRLQGGSHPPGAALQAETAALAQTGTSPHASNQPDAAHFLFFAPLDGNRLAIGLQAEHTRLFLEEQSRNTGTQAFLIDQHNQPTLGGAPAFDPTAEASRAAGLDGQALVSAAPVPDLGWRVVIASQAADALSGIRRGRDAAFLILMVVTAAAAGASLFLAGWITEPLRALAAAAGQAASGDAHAPLPRSRVGEVNQVLQAFEDMRRRLDQRTLERNRAANALQRANRELEERVVERTAALERANSSLRAENRQRRSAEARLEDYTRQLERSNQELQDFAYIASHDLQEPLRKIQAFGQRVLDLYQAQLDERGQDYLLRMTSSAARMQAMINALLTYSRVTTHAQPSQAVDLNRLLQNVISDLQISLQTNSGQVEVEELPVVQADPLQMQQLFQNLISNALKFHRPGVPPRVRVYNHSYPNATENDTVQTSYMQIVVEDNGIGFDVRYLDRIFQPFQRLHAKTTYPGSGIGLAICRKIVERHAGQLTAESAPGKGTRFIVTLPIPSKPQTADQESRATTQE